MGNNYTNVLIVVIIVLLIILQVQLTLYIDIIYPKHLLFVVLVIIIIVMNTSEYPENIL